MRLRAGGWGVIVCMAALGPLWSQGTQPSAPAGTPAQTQSSPAVPAPSQPSTSASRSTAPQGGTIRGIVIAGTVGKPDGVPLPGVAVTATNTLTGKKYAAATGIDGTYAMTIPRNGRYVVRAELAGFAPVTQEVLLNGSDTAAGATLVKTSDFGLELASRAAAAEARQEAAANPTALGRGTQSLSLNAGNADVTDASAVSGNSDVAMPTLGGLGQASPDNPGENSESIAVNGQVGQTNGLANVSEDQIRERVQEAVDRARADGQLPPGADPTNQIVSVIGGMMGGPGGFRGGGRGGRRGGGGFGNFRNFNPAQPHGNVFYQGGNNALNSAPWSPTPVPVPQPSGYQNRFGASIAGSPYIPGLTKPNTKQFGFLNISGQRNLNSFIETGRVPTALERQGDFSQSLITSQGANQSTSLPNTQPVELYDPVTGQPVPGNNLANASLPISPQALAVMNYYPVPNLPLTEEGDNYQTVANAGVNNFNLNARYVRTLGQAANTPFGRFGGGGGRGNRGNPNAPPTLRQNINIGYNFSHSASDTRNIFLPLGSAQQSGGNGLNVGYTIGYGRLSNNASVNWNRLNTEVRNYFTNTSTNPALIAGLSVPNNSGGFANPGFYNGLPSFSISNYTSLTNGSAPSELTNQTISFTDFVSWRHKKHNLRLGIDIRRVHADSIGGNDPLGSYTFTGYATSSPTDQVSGIAGTNTGDAFADFLLGLPTSTSIQAGLYKTYLRENVYDWYVLDDWRMKSNFTLNYSLRYEYFGPYSEKNNHLVNLSPTPNGPLPYAVVMPGNGNPAGLVHPDHSMYAPRLGFAYRPKNSGFTKDTVLRGGYSIMYNTGQYATFARNLSHQPPFSVTQNNAISAPTKDNVTPAPTGCTTTQSAFAGTVNGTVVNRPATTANLTLANGFGCSANAYVIQNNWAVDPNYKLGMVQIYNINLQRTIPFGIVLNLGYNGAKGSNLDVVGSPNATPSGVTTPSIAPFDWEESRAGSRANALVISAQKRQQKGIALGATYTYSHTIDNASGVGGAIGTPVQNLYRLDLEEGNSSFDRRHDLTGNWVIELPFGPNRAFLNKGGFWAYAFDGFSVSGTFTFASGNYLTPIYGSSESEALSANVFVQRPNRDFSQPIKGPGTLREWFNPHAFTNPGTSYGTASQGSIEGPGIVAITASLSRTFALGETRSFETRVTATNPFNTVQYSGIDVNQSDTQFGTVRSAAAMRTLQVQARYRF